MEISPYRVQVRFSDIDFLGHVNNVAYFSYFEMARIHYFHPILGPSWDWMEQGVVLVTNQATYLNPIRLHDQPTITVSVTEIGTKSFTLAYQVFVGTNLCATGSSKLVCFNSNTQQTIEIPTPMKHALNTLRL
ncbi:MAG: acyl-CoA thioesterase [Flavobacteriales bacterium]